MSNHKRITDSNLRHLIQVAEENAELQLPPGEYRGPFVFDRPITLTGLGDRPERVALWTKRGPVIIVRSPGVQIDNLLIEITTPEGRKYDPTILYAQDAKPASARSTIGGREELMTTFSSSAGWLLPAMIDLGTMRPRYSVNVPMVIEVPGPARLSTDVSDLMVAPAQLDVGGNHLITVGVSGEHLIKGMMFAGTLLIESGGESHAVWIIGHVLTDEEYRHWTRDQLSLIAPSGRRIGFEKGVLIGSNQFAGEAGADQVAEKQAYILKEESGAWSMLQPINTPLPTLVNGEPLEIGRRRLLAGNELIEVGNLRLQVDDTIYDPQIDISPQVDLGELSTSGPVHLHVANRSNQVWTGRLRSAVPWIDIIDHEVTIGAGQTADFRVQAGAEAVNLPRQKILYTGALVLESDNMIWVAGAQLDVDAVRTVGVAPTALDFGLINGLGEAGSQDIKIANSGTNEWQGTVQSLVPWIGLSKSALTVPPGTEATVVVELTASLAMLGGGVHYEQNAIELIGDGISQSISVGVEYAPPKIQVQPERVPLLIEDEPLGSAAFTLRNESADPWQGYIQSTLPWLSMNTDTIDCPPGHEVVVHIGANRNISTFRKPRNLRIDDALIIQGGDSEVLVGIHLDLRTPLNPSADALLPAFEGAVPLGEMPLSAVATQVASTADAEPQAADFGGEEYQQAMVIDFGTIVEWSRLPKPIKQILDNPYGEDLQVDVESTVPWLDVSPKNFKWEAGQATILTIKLTKAGRNLKPRQYDVEDAIQLIIDNGDIIYLPARLNIGKLSPTFTSTGSFPLTTEPQASSEPVEPVAARSTSSRVNDDTDLVIDFGPVIQGALTEPEIIHVPNLANKTVQGSIESTVPWLQIYPEEFSCDANQSIEIEVALTDAARVLRPRSYDVAGAIVISYEGIIQEVTAQIEIIARSVSMASIASQFPFAPANEEPASRATEVSGIMIQPESIDFGEVEDWNTGAVVIPVTIVSNVPDEFEAVITPNVPWISVSPEELICAPGEDTVFEVSLSTEASRLKSRRYSAHDGVIVDLPNARIEIEVAVVITNRGSIR